MPFSEVLSKYSSFDIQTHHSDISNNDISAIIAKPTCSISDFAALLSDNATDNLEIMAQRASTLTRNHFGHVISLFTPMYISSYCTNVCPYCSFSSRHQIQREHLTIDKIKVESRYIADSGIRQVLILTGEAPDLVPIDYLEQAVTAARDFFPSVAIEIYPLSENDYVRIVNAGADMLTLYQETYNESQYRELHPKGPKSDFHYRLDAPERACKAGMHAVTVGALLGLYDWRSDVFATGLHAAYLQKMYPGVEIGISLPRLRPQSGSFTPYSTIDDRHFVQMLTALRIFLPTVSITMSTRESSQFRMSVLPLGVTRMSAGVSTRVGGHSGTDSTPQFEISDNRDVDTIYKDLITAGYQPVLHDWNNTLIR